MMAKFILHDDPFLIYSYDEVFLLKKGWKYSAPSSNNKWKFRDGKFLLSYRPDIEAINNV